MGIYGFKLPPMNLFTVKSLNCIIPNSMQNSSKIPSPQNFYGYSPEPDILQLKGWEFIFWSQVMIYCSIAYFGELWATTIIALTVKCH